MSADGTVELTWAGGRRDTFCLAKIDALIDIEQKCGAGIFAIWQRLEAGQGSILDVVEPIRFGLVGGGMTPDQAQDVVSRHVKPPYMQHVFIAAAIIRAALAGVPGDEPGKDDAGKSAADRTEGGA